VVASSISSVPTEVPPPPTAVYVAVDVDLLPPQLPLAPLILNRYVPAGNVIDVSVPVYGQFKTSSIEILLTSNELEVISYVEINLPPY
jgi:hypothetical protein